VTPPADDPRWAPLTPQQAHALYKVPEAAAGEPGTTFYELTSHALSAQRPGPWPVVRVDRTPGAAAVSLYAMNIDEDWLQFDDFDPLTQAPSYLLLSERPLRALAALLHDLAQDLPAPTAPAGQPPFAAMGADEIAGTALANETSEGHRQSFHLQSYDPMGFSDGDVVVVLSAREPLPAYWLYVGVTSRSAPDSSPPAPALHVDQRGLEYLEGILTAELPYLKFT